MSSIPRDLGRRLDRLSLRAHAFHRLAHHPLCERYAPEVIRVGRKWRVCRGCAYAACGVLSGAVAGWMVRPNFWVAALASACGAWLVVRAFGPRPYGWARTPATKLISRWMPSAAVGSALLRVPEALTWRELLPPAVTIVLFGLAYAVYRRRGPERTPCTHCPERHPVRICSGFSEIVQRERAFRRLSARALAIHRKSLPIF